MRTLFTTLLLIIITCLVTSTTSSRYLQLTAVVSDNDGIARFQCWEISTPFSTYPTVGEVIPGLAAVANVSYVLLPPRSREGLHNAPYPMFFVLLSGLAHVTLPQTGEELWIMEGVNGLIVAADVEGEGHFTDYPSDKPTVALQIPFENGKMPGYRVVSKGVCEAERSGDDVIVEQGKKAAMY